jgi:hypothetical protein
MDTNTNNWAIYTHYSATNYTSHGPFSFSREKAYSFMECYAKPSNIKKDFTPEKSTYWIQQEDSDEKIYYKDEGMLSVKD